jgi:hypothetical protein
MARMIVERNVRVYRRGWLLLLSGFFEPVFYLFSLGVGLGTLVGDVDVGRGRGVPYAVFVAPAMLATSAMKRRGLRLDLQRVLQAQVRPALRRRPVDAARPA